MKRADIVCRYGLLALLALIFLGSCADEEQPRNYISIPVQISIPAESVVTRLPGDPGQPESFGLPKNARLLVVKGANDISQSSHVLKPDLWKLSGDIYYYADVLDFELPETLRSGRVFCILSQQPVVLENEHPSTEVEVKNACFLLSKNAGLSLKDLYANPVNDTNTKTNGTLEYDGKILHTNICCYHVASKVDIMWNVNPEQQKKYSLNELTLNNLPQKGYPFYPTTLNDNLTGSQKIVSGTTLTPGNKWAGRAVAYVLQSPNGTLNWEMAYNKINNEGINQVVRTPVVSRPENPGNTFTVWYRVNARIGFTPEP